MTTMRNRYLWVRGPVPAPVPTFGTPVGPRTGGGTVHVAGMSCAACVGKVQRAVGAIPGVTSVTVELASGTVHLQWSAPFAGLDQVREAVEGVGYGLGGA